MRTAVLAPLLLLAACHRGGGRPAAEPVQTLHDLTMSQSRSGSPAWELNSPLARLTEEDHKAILESPRMSFYREGRLVTKLDAATGLVRTDTQDVILSTDVIVRSLEDGSILTTSELDYSSSQKKFHTDKPVVVKRPNGTVHGVGLEANGDLSEIHIFHQRAVVGGEGPPA